MAVKIPDFLNEILGTFRRVGSKVVSYTQTFRPSGTNSILAAPNYQDHLNDLLDQRQALNAQDLMALLFRQDPDVSAAVGSYLTLADTPLHIFVKDADGFIDPEATKSMRQLVKLLFRPTDYSKGFQMRPSLERFVQEVRYMVMLRGAAGAELVFGKALVPDRAQQVDMASIEWFEKESGVFKPRQKPKAGGNPIDLDIPNFFVAYHRRNPTAVYPESDFVSAINTIAARTQIINDLYRIMRLTGYPRITIKVIEEVIRKNMPANVVNDPQASQQWIRDRLTSITGQFASIRADQPFVHTDTIEPSIMNKDRPGSALQIAEVIETLNAQNQAALKSMATTLGRAKNGTNTASVEARLAAMHADQLNVPVKELLDQMFTFLLNIYGIAGIVDCKFEAAELRPFLELEPQRVMLASRLRVDLSLGIITDEEYHLQVYGRLPPPGATKLSGTNFDPSGGPSVDVSSISPNSDPLGRSVAPSGSSSARSKATRQAEMMAA